MGEVESSVEKQEGLLRLRSIDLLLFPAVQCIDGTVTHFANLRRWSPAPREATRGLFNGVHVECGPM